MMAGHGRNVLALSLGVVLAIGGCVSQSTAAIPSETINPVTASSVSTARDTGTPRPEKTPTIAPTSTGPQTLTPESTLVSGWFSIPALTQPGSVDFSTARSYKGLRIPPLPEELAIEIYSIQPYGEVPPDTIFYQLFLVRKGNARMLWLGIPFKETGVCCGRETPNRLYDSIPFPAIETDSLLIPFVCMRNQKQDIFLIVVSEPPEKDASATNILYAWRIDPETISFKPFSTQGIECSPNW